MYKKILLLLAGGLMFSLQMQAQSEMTAVKLANTEDNYGSARYQALSGAMGAVGVDFSSVARNPAGIALLKRNSRIDLTLGYQGDKGQSKWYDAISNTSRNKLNFDQLSFNLRLNSGLTGWTIGFAIRDGGSMRRTIDASATNITSGTSLADYAAARFNKLGDDPIGDPNNAQHTFDDFNASKDPFQSFPWISTLGVQSDWLMFAPMETKQVMENGKLVNKVYPAQFMTNYNYDNNGVLEKGRPSGAGLTMEEEYSITEADFALGFSLSNRLSLGFVITSKHLDYNLRSSYSEAFRPSKGGNGYDGLSLDNSEHINGVGASFGFGVIAQPLNGLRLGASVYTPTFYKFDYDFGAGTTGHSPITPDGKTKSAFSPDDAATTFCLNTPWRFGLNMAYIIKHYGLISVDYEYSTFGSSKLYLDTDGWDDENPFDFDNEHLSKDFKGIHSLRIGTEMNLTKRLALRAGYRFATSPVENKELDKDFPQEEAFVAGTAVQYTLPKGRYGLSAGIGYRITPMWSVDLAYVYSQQKSSIYAFPAIGDPVEDVWLKGLKPIKQIDKQHRVALTIGMRF